MKTVESPCIFVCTLDASDICVGCGRSAQEIMNWTSYSDEEKALVVEESIKRLEE